LTEDPPEAKYAVQVVVPDKSPPTPKQYVQDLKGVVGGKQLAKMKKEAVRLGKDIVQKEAELDSIFNTVAAESEVVRNLVTKIAELEGELRLTHLNAHLLERAILSEEQIALYDELRGYKIK